MYPGEKRKHETKYKISDSVAKKPRQPKAPPESSGPGQSGVALCLTALDHCIEQIPFINDQKTLKSISGKADALLRAAQARMNSRAAAVPQQQQPELHHQQKGAQTQQARGPAQARDLQSIDVRASKEQQEQQLQQRQPQQDAQPLQVLEDKQPFVFTAHRNAAAIAGGNVAAGADGRVPNSNPPRSTDQALQQETSKKPLTQQQQQQQQPPKPISSARAALQGYILAAQAKRGMPAASGQLAAGAQVQETTTGSASQASGSTPSSRTSRSGSSRQSSGSRSGNSTSSSSDGNSSSSSDDSSSSSSDDSSSSSSDDSSSSSSDDSSSSSSDDSSSNSDGSSSSSSDDSSSDKSSSDTSGSKQPGNPQSSGKDKGSKPPHAAAAAASTSPASGGPQQLSQWLHQCLVCKRMVETGDLFANKLVITCKLCVAGAVAGAVSRLSHCPKRGCGAVDIKLGPAGYHQGSTGLKHYVSVTALKGFSIHYVKRKLTKRQAAAAKALQEAGRKGLLGSPVNKRPRKKQQ